MCRVKILRTTQTSLTKMQRTRENGPMSLQQIQFTLDYVRQYADHKDIAWDKAFAELKQNKGLEYLIALSGESGYTSSRRIMSALKKF